MTLATINYLVIFRISADHEQEEKEFATKIAAEDYVKTVHLLGGVAILQTRVRNQGEML